MNHPYIQQHTYSGAHQTKKQLHNLTLLLCVDQSEPSLKGKVNALLKTAQQQEVAKLEGGSCVGWLHWNIMLIKCKTH